MGMGVWEIKSLNSRRNKILKQDVPESGML